MNANVAKPPPALAVAVKKNIKLTSAFFEEMQRLVRAAKEAPDTPIILEAHGSRAYEAVHAVPVYLHALGATNPVSVEYHRDEQSKGALFDRLQASMAGMQDAELAKSSPRWQKPGRPRKGVPEHQDFWPGEFRLQTVPDEQQQLIAACSQHAIDCIHGG